MYQAKYVLYFGNFKLSETIVTQWIIMAFLIIVAFLLTRNIQKVPTSKKQVFLEWAIGGLRNLVTETTGTAFKACTLDDIIYWNYIFVLCMFGPNSNVRI